MSQKALTLNKARVSYGVIHALQGFSGSFLPGQVTALTGGDGAGKSTLLKLLAGGVSLESGSIHGLPDKKKIGYQPADSGVWRDMSVMENMRFIAAVYGMDPDLARNRIDQLLNDADLTYARNTIGRNLSGGMRQKLGFIMAALHEPDLLLLDEPTTGVDPASREGIWTLISAQAADGRIVVFATTYLDEAERCASLYLMNDGKILAQGDVDDICAKAPGKLWQAPASVGKRMTRDSFFGSKLQDRPPSSAFHNWRRADTALVWTASGDNRIPEGFTRTDFDLENASIAYLLQDDQGGLPTKPRATVADLDTRQGKEGLENNADKAEELDKYSLAAPAIKAGQPDGRILIQGRDVVKRFGTFTALNRVSIQVKSGQIIGLIGGNGAGKTTLMRILLGLEQPNQGTTSLLGRPPSLESRKRIGYVPQGMGIYPTLTAWQNTQFTAEVYGTSPQDWTVKYAQSLGRTPVGSLPLGAQRLLAYALAAGHDTDLLILDEPTSGMDPVSRMRLWRELHRKADQGVGILVTTHYMAEASQCDQCLILARGQVQTQGSIGQIIGSHYSLVIRTVEWEQALKLLTKAGLPVSMDGRTLRLIDANKEEVERILQPLKSTYVLTKSKARLDEILTLTSIQG